MKNIFQRLVGNPSNIQEPVFTQVLVSVLERDEDLTRSLGEWLFAQKGQTVDLSGTDVTVLDEKTILPGGIPDFILEYRKQGVVQAAIVAENKLEAPITNPLNSYLQEVKNRQNSGQKSMLVLISRRNARNDKQLEPFLGMNEFFYLDWYKVYQQVSDYLKKSINRNQLTDDLCAYLEGMGMNTGGKFSFVELGLGAYYPQLVEKLDKVIGNERLGNALGKLRTRIVMAQYWKLPFVYARYVFTRSDTNDYVSAGFAYTTAPYWKDTFENEPCPIVAFVGLGTEDWTDLQRFRVSLGWIKSLEKAKGIKLKQNIWHEKNHGVEFYLVAYKPLVDFITNGDDHLEECRKYLLDRLSEVASIFAKRCEVSAIFPLCSSGNPVSPDSLVSSPPAGHPFPWMSVQQKFQIGNRSLDVTSNVLYLPTDWMQLLQSALLLEHPGVDGILAKMRLVINEIESFVGKLTDPKPQIEEIMEKLKSIADQLSATNPDELCRQLKEWDDFCRKLMNCMGEIIKIPPIYLFLRPGFFLDRSMPLNGLSFPPGCYIEESLSSEEKEQTRLHEMAHAAMATYRVAGSVVGCRWMEEGFAEFLVSCALPTPDQCRESWGELDVYMAWKYLEDLKNQPGKGIGEVEKLLERWLSPQPLCAFRDDVRKMRDFIAQRYGRQLSP